MICVLGTFLTVLLSSSILYEVTLTGTGWTDLVGLSP